ncbi:MAG TPA: uracil-DNA glycosylase [Pyrinomonadaceae bacterium]|nr:uracil-DNA glycosylase [Pyrinomonadaceae bacterium]
MNEDLSNLISELREQVLYLQELGVDSLNAELPNLKFSSIVEEPVQKSKIQDPKLDYVVPGEEILKMVSTKSIEAKIEPPKTNTQGNSRLSNLLKLSKISTPENIPVPIQTNTEPMPKKTIELNPTETLFGDISQALPDSTETVAEIQAEIGNCQRCDLCKERTKIAHSTGNLQADLMFVGEAPGADEDVQGKPFVGKAGQLLTKIIEAIGMKREDVFIGNINRCRPPGNRQPTPVESATCKPYLIREIAVVRPKVIVVLGNTACQNLLETKVGITKLRGNFQDFYGVKVMPTFHPAYLLRDPSKKREAWEDMKKVRDYLNSLG